MAEKQTWPDLDWDNINRMDFDAKVQPWLNEIGDLKQQIWCLKKLLNQSRRKVSKKEQSYKDLRRRKGLFRLVYEEGEIQTEQQKYTDQATGFFEECESHLRWLER